MPKLSHRRVRAHLRAISELRAKADVYKSVTGSIPTSILDAVDSALRIVIPMTSFLGDFELTTLLSSLKVWLQKKRMEKEQEDAQLTGMQSLTMTNYWNPSY